MASTSRLGRQIEEVVATLDGLGVPFALIGGLALASHNVIRATQGVDLLIDASRAEEIDKALSKLGYHCVHRTPDAGNYLRGDERLDFLYANRPVARRLLSTAPTLPTAFGALHVITTEGLIAFKLQGWVNDSRRTQDLEDIRALLRANRDTVDLAEVREYFGLFQRQQLLDDLLNEIG